MTVGSITAAPIETAFSITDDGTLEAHGPDGTATLAAKVTITSRGRLRWCEGSHCLDLKP